MTTEATAADRVVDFEAFERRCIRAAPAGGDRVAPHNLEAEKSVLGAILVQNEAYYRVVEVGLEPRDFYREAEGLTALDVDRLPGDFLGRTVTSPSAN